MDLAHPKTARSNQQHLVAQRAFDSTSTAPIGFCAALTAFLINVIQPYYGCLAYVLDETHTRAGKDIKRIDVNSWRHTDKVFIGYMQA